MYFLRLNKLITTILPQALEKGIVFLPQAHECVIYLDYMNKDVIYLEPEDDITDILTKLQQAEQKLVALVPPKKSTILRSAVNMKLVARVAKECEKVAVVVTADPAIVKMAMLAKIPVAKTLQSRPIVPTEENIKKAEADEQIIDEESENDEPVDGKIASKASKTPSEAAHAKKADALDLTEESLQKPSKKPEKAKSAKKPSSNDSFFQKYRKLILIGSGAAVVLVVFLVWALIFAPAVKITVAISSTPSSFSETVRFTTDKEAQNPAENLLYAEQITLDDVYKTSILATGKDDRGEKAKGRLTVSVGFIPKEYLGIGYSVEVSEGDVFVNSTNKLNYVATSSESVGWDGEKTVVECDNGNLSGGSALTRTCRLSVTVSVEAEDAGEEYNISANSSWNSFDGGSVTNGSPIAGGTTNIVKVISNEDLEKVKSEQVSEHSEGGKEDLLDDLQDDVVPIEASFKAEATDVKTTPDASEEIKDGDEPTAEVKVTYSVYVVKKSDIEAYIQSKLNLADDQKIYSIGDPYFERFTDIENDARLKTNVETGPTVTKEEILEKVKGRKTGQVKSILQSINGVSDVNISTSYFWVWSVPEDPRKITIDLSVEDKA